MAQQQLKVHFAANPARKFDQCVSFGANSLVFTRSTRLNYDH
ncbi:hypothetical protein PG5_21900 [Pseudomonas sp. G5(2012)]|nr:hypothetical protein PG5_21900 [Pseudomonas sp. G5(2012)]